MRRLKLTIGIVPFVVAAAVVAFTQERSANAPLATAQSDERAESLRLNAQISELYKQRKYDEAIPLGRRVLEIEERVNPETPNVAAALSNLGELYYEKGDEAQAENLFEKATAIYEKHQTKSAGASNALERLAQFGFKRRKYDKVINLLERSLAIREQAFGVDSVAVSETLHELANVFHVKRESDKADALYLRSIAIKERSLGRANENTVVALKDYACLRIKNNPILATKRESPKDLSAEEAEKESIRMRAACWLYGFDKDCETRAWKPAQEPWKVLNGKAIRLVQPAYPREAREKRLSGRVFVAVVIDERGDVSSAKPICGGVTELNAAGLQAARASKFTPTLVSGAAVKVTGLIVYNFIAR